MGFKRRRINWKHEGNWEKIEHEFFLHLQFIFESAIKEELHLPFHETAMIPLVNEQGKWDAALPLYSGTIREQCKKAIEYARRNPNFQSALGNPFEDRYKKEERLAIETLELLQFIAENLPEVAHTYINALAQSEDEPLPTPPEGWGWYTAPLPTEALAGLGLDANERPPVLIGPPVFAVYPSNTQTYKEGKSFWNVYRVCYLPTKDAWIILLHQAFNDFSHQEHAQAISEFVKTWGVGEASASRTSSAPTESEIMRAHIIHPPFAYEEVEPFFSSLLTNALPAEEIAQLAVAQQEAMNLFRTIYQPIIAESSQFLTDIFLDVWGLLLKKHISIDQAEALILMNAEVALNTILQQKMFDSAVAWEQYEKVAKPEVFQSHKGTALVSARNALFSSFQNTSMSHVLKRVVSVVDCTAGSAGGITRLNPNFASSISTNSLGLGIPSRFSSLEEFQRAVRTESLTLDEKIRIINHNKPKRWETAWHDGTCKMCNDGKFHYKHLDGGVGECDVCFACEMRDTLGKGAEKQEKDGVFSTTTSHGYVGVDNFIASFAGVSYNPFITMGYICENCTDAPTKSSPAHTPTAAATEQSNAVQYAYAG